MKRKPTLCLDFDGVIHSYVSGWQGVENIPDPPTPGALLFLINAMQHFQVVIFSTRCASRAGRKAIRSWLKDHAGNLWYECPAGPGLEEIKVAKDKPPAMVTLDDRAVTFEGMWPDPKDLLAFKPWNKREIGALGTLSEGSLCPEDEGDLRFRVGVRGDSVCLEFGKPVQWLGLPYQQAQDLAAMILKHAEAVRPQ